MATMLFRVSKEEFTKILAAIRKNPDIKRLETDDEKNEAIVSFLNEFMVDTDNEEVLGHYDYVLEVDGEVVLLDVEDDERLKELVSSCV